MRHLWCRLCYHIVLRWPFETWKDGFSRSCWLWFLPAAGEWAWYWGVPKDQR